MKTISWGGLFLVSFLAGHFLANPWLAPVGNILLFIKIYLVTLFVMVVVQQTTPYIWRNLRAWMSDLRRTADDMEEAKVTGGMQLSFAAAGLPNVREKRLENARDRIAAKALTLPKQEDEMADALSILRATAIVAAKSNNLPQEPKAPRTLYLLPPVKPVQAVSSAEESVEPVKQQSEDLVDVPHVEATNEQPVSVHEEEAGKDNLSLGAATVATEIILGNEQNSVAENKSIETMVDFPADSGEVAAVIIDPANDDAVPDDIDGELFDGVAGGPADAFSTPVAWSYSAIDDLTEMIAADATGMVMESEAEPEPRKTEVHTLDPDPDNYAVEGTDISFESTTTLAGGMFNGGIDQIVVVAAKVAEVIEVAETVDNGTALLAEEESVDSDVAAAEPDRDDFERGREDTVGMAEEKLPADDFSLENPSESQPECIHVETTNTGSRLDQYESLELAAINRDEDAAATAGPAPIDGMADEPSQKECVKDVADEIADAPRPVVVRTDKQPQGLPNFPSYSCRLRCSTPGGLLQGPILGFYCRFICQHGNG